MKTETSLGADAINYVTSLMFVIGMVMGLAIGAYLLLMVG